jgi:dethiobiotin synthetase/adenosylmethionine--8-amino-7-oxononanoate aminotransferase
LTDNEVLEGVHRELKSYANGEDGVSIVETAGGVLSPSPSGSSQADLYRPLRLPTLLVGDHKLGGIGTTISAWESLRLRGYDVDHIALFAEGRYDNHTYLKQYFRDRGVSAFSIAPPPERLLSAEEDAKAMLDYYQSSSETAEVQDFIARFFAEHDQRIESIRSLPGQAEKVIWHPFMQHTERSKDTITAWDSAYGDFFQSFTTKRDASSKTSSDSETSLVQPAFDGSASWWTQGLGHGNPQLALTAAHAAGRYGHVMFGGAIHEPALQLAQTLVARPENPRLSKVFYSDNGSTGMEVAVKMGLRASVNRYLGNRSADHRKVDIRILGLKNSYHGDTIGTMDCSEPSIYNEKVEWYKGRGIWLDFPTIKMRQGRWLVEPFESGSKSAAANVPLETKHFDSIDDIFDFGNRRQDHEAYTAYIRDTLSESVEKHGVSFGALIIEPMLLGAGGMMFADPLYQRCLVEVAREFHHDRSWLEQNAGQDSAKTGGSNWTGMPVIFDEVFTGLYRLGRFSAASFLGVHPDIVVNAKLLTGGLLPLCTTTTSEAIFGAFLSNDKTDALLHGHSYTAHPIGCSVANESLKTLTKLDTDGTWDVYKNDWKPQAPTAAASGEHIWSMWSSSFLVSASHKSSVDNVFAIGSVLAMSLKDPNGSGYASTAATGLRDKLLAGNGQDEAVIHSRVLGNVLYLMAALNTPEKTLHEIQDIVLEALE